MLYSYNGAYPTQKPKRIRLSDGTTRTDPDSFTSEELIEAGWVEVPDKPVVEYPNVVVWTGSEWQTRVPNAAERQLKWQRVKEQIRERVKKWDGLMLKELEQGLQPNNVIVQYRQALREIPQNQSNPFNITWPTVGDFMPSANTANTANT